MKEFTASIIEKNLNDGWTTKQFAEYYEMTENEFLSSLDKLSNVKNYIDSIKRRLTRNNKKFRQISITSNVETQKNEEVKSEPTENFGTTNTSFTKTESIDSLLKSKEELEASIQKSKDYISKTPSYIAYIEEQKSKEIARHESYMAGYQEKIDKAISRQNAISENIKRNSDELERILEKIESLSNIKVTVTDNGDIVIENNSISIPKKWQDVCFDIMRNDSFKDLEIKDMKTLAKLWCLINSEENISKKFKIHFESERLEKLFELLKEHKKN